ncbi:class I adenylate-forming enzyme family protein [Kitasatospora purpeofusca]|uniref:class I adenylate-forming enzyme family protein n=1 Tax=Kitasatospora purpeofusca TaxID=67352 RepID=UPI0035DCE74B
MSEQDPTPKGLHRLLDDAAARHPHRTAVIEGARAVDYAHLSRRVDRLARRLAAVGVRRGDRVVLLMANNLAFVESLHAVLRSGATAVPVSPDTKPFQLRKITANAQPVLLLTDRADRDLPLLDGLPTHTPDDLPTALPPTAVPAAPDGPPAFLLYTSGSTSDPKGVICPPGAVLFAVHAIARRLGYTEADTVYCRPPFSFDYGLYQILLCALAGATLVVSGDQPEVATLRIARDSGATVMPLVPTLAASLLTLARRDPRPTRLRLFTNTGEHLPSARADALRATFPGAEVVPMYGMTECKRITIADPVTDPEPGADPALRACVGRALPGTTLRILDEDGEPVLPGTVGEIVVSGPHLMAGYWRDPEETALRYGHDRTGRRVLRTGDYGSLDAEGRLRLEGRRDDLIKRRGMRTSTAEIESAACDIPGVAEACLTGAEDGTLTLWYVGAADPVAVTAGLRERLEGPKLPDGVASVAALPRTVNGKIDRRRLTESAPRTAPAGGRS